MHAAMVPGPPELLPGLPDAVIDLQTEAGIRLIQGQWRYHDAAIAEIDSVGVGPDLGPSGSPNRTYDIVPHAEAIDFDDTQWEPLSPAATEERRGTGRVCFNWYRLSITLPDRIGDFDPTGSTVVLEIVIDDYAEIWVDGQLPLVLGQTGGPVVGGFNVPNRVVLGRDVRPGQRLQVAIFGMNGPISASPRNYIWIRSATLDFFAAERARPAWPVAVDIKRAHPALNAIVPPEAVLERVAGGFIFTEGPVWARAGYLLFSSPNTNAIYRWAPDGRVDLFRTKSGYTGPDISRYTQPGSNGLTFDAAGRLTICQHGNRRIIRVEPRGNITVLADRYQGRRLNSPNDLVYHSDGSLYFTDPPFGLPETYADPAKELDLSGVYRVRDGEVTLLTDALRGPNGLAFSPDERYLYVGNWDPESKVVMRYTLAADGRFASAMVFCDLTTAPGEDAIDGIKVDQMGNVYICGPGGVWIFSPTGQQLGLIRGPESAHNLAWGDDGRTLYMTALSSIYRMRLLIPGAPLLTATPAPGAAVPGQPHRATARSG